MTNIRLNAAFAALTILFSLGGESEAAPTSSSAGIRDLSGPAVFSAFWGTRMPRVCARLSAPPNAAQATALIQCYQDRETRESVYLVQNIKIRMDGTRNFVASDGITDNVDSTAKAYLFHGSNDYYFCAPINESVMHNTARNCSYTRTASTTGSCWRALDGSYHCEMHFLAGPEGRANTYEGQPGPTTY